MRPVHKFSPAVCLHVLRVQSVCMYITYLTQRTTILGLGLRQHGCGDLNRLVAINIGPNYLEFGQIEDNIDDIECVEEFFRNMVFRC